MEEKSLSLYEHCQDCLRCCADPGSAIVFERELEKVRAYLTENNIEDHVREREGENQYYIPRDADGCLYLKDGACEIQEVKPEDCQVFPLSLTDDLEIGVASMCPLEKTNILDSFFDKKKAEGIINNLSLDEKLHTIRMYRKEGYTINND